MWRTLPLFNTWAVRSDSPTSSTVYRRAGLKVGSRRMLLPFVVTKDGNGLRSPHSPFIVAAIASDTDRKRSFSAGISCIMVSGISSGLDLCLGLAPFLLHQGRVGGSFTSSATFAKNIRLPHLWSSYAFIPTPINAQLACQSSPGRVRSENGVIHVLDDHAHLFQLRDLTIEEFVRVQSQLPGAQRIVLLQDLQQPVHVIKAGVNDAKVPWERGRSGRGQHIEHRYPMDIDLRKARCLDRAQRLSEVDGSKLVFLLKKHEFLESR